MIVRTAAILAAAVSCLSSAAHAETAREPVSARVSVAGLDLSSVEGRRLLDRRIDAAIRAACTSHATGHRGFADTRRCRAEMRGDAQVRVARLVRPVEVAVAR